MLLTCWCKEEDENGELIWDLPSGTYLVYDGDWEIYDWDDGWRFHTGIPKYADVDAQEVYGPLPEEL